MIFLTIIIYLYNFFRTVVPLKALRTYLLGKGKDFKHLNTNVAGKAISKARRKYFLACLF